MQGGRISLLHGHMVKWSFLASLEFRYDLEPDPWLMEGGQDQHTPRPDAQKIPVWSLGLPHCSGSLEAQCQIAEPLYSCLENSMHRGAWQAIVHGVSKSWTQMSDFHSLHSVEGAQVSEASLRGGTPANQKHPFWT